MVITLLTQCYNNTTKKKNIQNIRLQKKTCQNNMAENKEEESSKRVIYTYPMVKQTDMPDDMKVKLLETSIRYTLKCNLCAISLSICFGHLENLHLNESL